MTGEFLVRPLEHSDRRAVIHMHELLADDALEFGDQPLADALVEGGEGLRVFATADVGRRGAAVRAVIVLDKRTSGLN